MSRIAGYLTLFDVYEWLVPDAKLTPDGAASVYRDLVGTLPPGARVLDCACGTGQLAVGLARLGLEVDATDASAGMVRRTRELAHEAGAGVRTLQATWDELSRHFDAGTFDLVLCVGNSLGHAEGAHGRSAALAAMAHLLTPGGRLVLTSRTWELVRARGSRLETWDRLVRRRGEDAVVTYSWQVAQQWEQEHHLEIAVARIGSDGSVHACAERLSVWPFRYEELVAELRDVGLRVESSTFDGESENYLVVAGQAPPPSGAASSR